MRRYRVAHLINNLSRGGAEILLKDSINLFPEYEHLIIYLDTPDDLMAEIKGNVHFICLYHHSWKYLIRTRKRIRKIIREWLPDIIHAHLFDSTIVARLSKVRNIPIISTIHSTYSHDAFEKSKKALILERLTANRQQGFIGVSGYVLNDYLKHVPFKGATFVLYNFLPQKNIIARNNREINKDRELRCVAVGNLKEAKNYFYLLEAFAHLKDYPITLDIFGEGLLRAQLTSYIQEKGLNVQLCGQVSDILNVLPNYDMFIQASSHEGFGISVAEAISLKLPVLLSNIPVFREITNEKAHFFPLNDVQVLAAILKNLYQDEAKRTQFVHCAYDQIYKISSEDTYKRDLHQIYSYFIQTKS